MVHYTPVTGTHSHIRLWTVQRTQPFSSDTRAVVPLSLTSFPCSRPPAEYPESEIYTKKVECIIISIPSDYCKYVHCEVCFFIHDNV